MKILGIGNAIVDVICKVDDNFITKNNLTKSTMKLFFDENEFKNLLTNLKIEKTVSGGSVANSIVGLSQLGDKVGFIGKVSDDEFGSKYEEGLKKENVEYFYSKKKEELPTGTCLILVTPDSERTMCTFLGTAGKINENDVSSDAIKKSEIIFLEGYLWDEGEPKKAFDKAINNANKVAVAHQKNQTQSTLVGAGTTYRAGTVVCYPNPACAFNRSDRIRHPSTNHNLYYFFQDFNPVRARPSTRTKKRN